jgi:hypothetical protein
MKRLILLIGISLATLSFVPGAAACTNSDDVFDQAGLPMAVSKIIGTFVDNGCYGGSRDANQQTTKIRVLLDEIKNSGNTPEALERAFLARVSAIEVALDEYIGSKPQDAQFDEARKAWEAFEDGFGKVAMRGDGEGRFWRIDVPTLSPPAYPEFNGKKFLDDQCPEFEQLTATCNLAVKETLQIIRAAELLAEIIKVTEFPNALTHLNASKLRLQQWDDYFNKAEPLWPMELALNSVLEMDGGDFDSQGNLIGFREVPDKQHLFLHPSTALEYFEDESSDSDFKPAVLLDIYGVNFLNWSKSTRRLKSSHGISLTASFSSHEDSNDLGWGLRYFNNKKWALGITKHSDRVGIFVSIGLMEQLTDWQKKIDQWKEKHESWKNGLGLN